MNKLQTLRLISGPIRLTEANGPPALRIGKSAKSCSGLSELSSALISKDGIGYFEVIAEMKKYPYID